MNNKVQKRKRNASIQVTFDGVNQGHEHHVTRTRRRVQLVGKDCNGGDERNIEVVSGRHPWHQGTRVHRDHQQNEVQGRPQAVPRRTSRHPTIVRRNRRTDAAAAPSTTTLSSNHKDASAACASKVVHVASKVVQEASKANPARTARNISTKGAASTSASSHKNKPAVGTKPMVFCDASTYNGVKKTSKGSSQTTVLRDVSNDKSVRSLPNNAPLVMVLRARSKARSKASVTSKGRQSRAMHETTTTPTATASDPCEDAIMDLVRRVDGDLSMHEADEVVEELWDEQYATDILKYLKGKETIAQEGIEANELCCVPSHRLILVDWLVDVQHHLSLEVETLHLGVAMSDEYMRRDSVSLDFLQLLGITCLFVAAKYEEIYLPELSALCSLCANIYKPDQLLVMERKVLRTLDFTFSPTSIAFLNIFLTSNDLDDQRLTLTCHYLLELMLLDCGLQKSLPSLRAAAAIHLALLVAAWSENDNDNGDDDGEVWTWKLATTTGYLQTELEPIEKEVVNRLRHIQTATHKAVFTKYAQRSHKHISLHPALVDPTFLFIKTNESCK